MATRKENKSKLKVKSYNLKVILIIVSLGGLLLGMETSSMPVFIGSDYFFKYFSNPSSIVQGIIAASNPAGAFFGCLASGFISDGLGRLAAIQIASTTWISGSLVSILVQNVQMIIAGRAVKGVAIGIFSSVLPVYISEIFPPEKKGLGTSVMQWSLTWGIMIMFYLSYFCNFMGDDRAFRVAWGIEMVPSVTLLICSIFLPESPKWLAARSKWSKAGRIMRKLKENYLPNGKASESVVRDDIDHCHHHNDDNLEEMEYVMDKYDSKNCTYPDLFRRRLRKHLLIGVTTQLFVQLSGISVLMYYLVYICQMIGLNGNVKMLSASIQYVVNVLFTIFPILWIDKMRRKDVLVFGASTLGICISAIGSIMGYYGHNAAPIGGNESVVWEVTGTPGSVCLALCFLFVAIFASTLSCAGWLYTNEIFPVRAKAKGSAVCMSVSWAVNFTLTFVTPISLKYIKWITFIIFGALGITGAFVMGFFFPETYSLSEELIDNLYKDEAIDAAKDQEANRGGDNVRSNHSGVYVKTASIEMRDLVIPGDDNEAERTSKAPSSRNPTSERTYKSSIPSHVNGGFQHNIIQKTDSSDNSRIPENVSPFFKRMGGPFETDSDLSALEQNVEGTGGDESTTYTAGLISHYYDQRSNGSPFMNQYNGSPFK